MRQVPTEKQRIEKEHQETLEGRKPVIKLVRQLIEGTLGKMVGHEVK